MHRKRTFKATLTAFKTTLTAFKATLTGFRVWKQWDLDLCGLMLGGMCISLTFHIFGKYCLAPANFDNFTT